MDRMLFGIAAYTVVGALLIIGSAFVPAEYRQAASTVVAVAIAVVLLRSGFGGWHVRDLGTCDLCSQPITEADGCVWVRCEPGSDERCLVHAATCMMPADEVWERFYVEQSGGTWNVRDRDNKARVVRMPGPQSAYRVARICNYPHEMLPKEQQPEALCG